MVVMTAKVSKTKLLALLVLLAVIIIAVVLLLRGGGGERADTAENAVPTTGVTTNEKRIAYLSACGWEVAADPVETQEVLIPEEMSEVFEAYNDLQRSQGFDLTRFAGKQVKRYVYEVTNFDGTSEPVYVTLLIHKGSVIGGDVTSTAGNGKMQGLTRQTPAQPEQAADEANTDAANAAEAPIADAAAAEPEASETAGDIPLQPAA